VATKEATELVAMASLATDFRSFSKNRKIDFIGALGKRVVNVEFVEAPELKRALFKITAPPTALSN
jgi:hypothetical protein